MTKKPILLTSYMEQNFAGKRPSPAHRKVQRMLDSEGASFIMICISTLLLVLAGGISEFEAGHLGTFGGVLPALENFLVILGGAFITTGLYLAVRPSTKQCPGCKIKIKRVVQRCPYCHNQF